MNVAADQTPSNSDDLGEIIAGLKATPKTVSPKYFYDELGSQLFDQICELDEYYPTRTELSIMQENIGEIGDLIGPQASLIEYGSGSSYKTKVLLEHLNALAVYVPVDISTEFLFATAEQMRLEFPNLEILPVAADFTQPFQLPSPKIMPLRNIVYFPGSTIGNFPKDAALDLLRVMHGEAGEDGAMLIGVDLQKEPHILESAYNDSREITAAFNLNLLQRLNNEFGANFDLDQFAHRAIYNGNDGRIEMYLDSLADQSVIVGGETIEFSEGEALLTEHSHKYTLQGFAEMADAAGFTVEKVWTDPDQLFSVQYCVRR